MTKSINKVNNDSKILIIEDHFREIMLTLGLDLNDSELRDTPHRVAKSFVNELFSGLDKAKEPKMTVFDNKVKYDQIIALKNMNVVSTCAHHFLGIDMVVSIAYIPSDSKYVGISKLARIAMYFSKRPQTQEQYTHQICDFLEMKLKPKGIMVYVTGVHNCMKARGVQMHNAEMITSEVRGLFRANLELENKFVNMIKK